MMCKRIVEIWKKLYQKSSKSISKSKDKFTAKSENEKARDQFYDDMGRGFLDDEF